MLPKTQALRLCNRFGKGPKARITTVPEELISAIEEYMLSHARFRATIFIEEQFKCFESQCQPADHLFLDDTFFDGCGGADCPHCSPEDGRHPSRDHLNEIGADDPNTWLEEHRAFLSAWEDRLVNIRLASLRSSTR